MDAMTIPDVWSGQDRALTVEDMENMPDDEFRYELDDGVLIVSPAPSTLHQQHRVPDVAVVRAGSLDSFFQETPPELVVEVASARTRLYDRNRKKEVCEGFGIPVYWIVEPSSSRPELTAFELGSGAYEQTAHIIGGEEYRAAVPFPVTIVPSQLVRRD